MLRERSVGCLVTGERSVGCLVTGERSVGCLVSGERTTLEKNITGLSAVSVLINNHPTSHQTPLLISPSKLQKRYLQSRVIIPFKS